jgi:beta-galactosidase
LVSEGLPAYFGDHGRVGPKQPNYGLDQLGARESYVEFTPDLLDNLTLQVQGRSLFGRYFLQEYEAAGGRPQASIRTAMSPPSKTTSGKDGRC